MELCLPLVTAICTDRVNPEGESFDHNVDELYSIGLSVSFINLECPDPRSVIDRGLLISSNLRPLVGVEVQEFNVHLDVMAWDIISVTTSMGCTTPNFT